MSDEAKLPYGDEVPYWKTGRSSPDVWVEKTKSVLFRLGVKQVDEAFGSVNGRAAFMLAFESQGEKFRVCWPVLRVRKPEDEPAARIQAATLLYHDCKAKAVAASVLGLRTAFFAHVALPDGRTMADIATPLLAAQFPKLLSYKSEE